jgi:hypothetical protein
MRNHDVVTVATPQLSKHAAREAIGVTQDNRQITAKAGSLNAAP